MNEFIFRSVIESWANCEQNGISKEIKEPQKLITEDELHKQTQKKEYLTNFRDFMHKYIDAIRMERGYYCFLVLNEELTILDVFFPRWINISGHCTHKKYLRIGVSFCSNSVGTNAVCIAKQSNTPVYLEPQLHYCNVLKEWHEYCVPIWDGYEKVYVSLIRIGHPISSALKGFVDLLAKNMCCTNHTQAIKNDLPKKLTPQHKLILKRMAQGMTDEQIAHELEISLSTVRFHTQNIFKIFNVGTRIEAVMKAIMQNEIFITDLYN
jgi:DNA-binding CsgD family transcriptional regulator